MSRPIPTTPWWRDAVVYQVYPRSFRDHDGDGVGDLRGIVEGLGALAELGVDAIWLNPFYPSPQVDAGYDVSDHREVDPLFGDLATFDELVAASHALGLRVVVDLVPNHTSDQHPWFRRALAAAPGSPERQRYLFRPGRGALGDRPPNDWQSVFGGPAWTRVRGHDPTAGEWYLHLFAPQQPDLDWTNAEVRAEYEDVLRFWLDRGVDGFRIDVAHGLAKDPGMPDLSGRFATSGLAHSGHPHWDRDEVHEVFRSWRRVLDGYPGDRMFVAEAYLADATRLARYVRSDELHTAFNFRFLMATWDVAELRAAVDETLTSHAAVGAPATWVLSNHDVVRTVTRYGGGVAGHRRARAAALLMFALPGSAYVYQGEELGLPEVVDLPDSARQDPTFRRTGGALPGRDGCRVPIPWDAERPACGFSPTGASWLPQPRDWSLLSRDRQQRDGSSMLHLYRRAIALRRSLGTAAPGAAPFEWLDLGPDVLAFSRGSFVSLTNLGPTPVRLPGPGEVVLSSDPAASDRTTSERTVATDVTVWFEPTA